MSSPPDDARTRPVAKRMLLGALLLVVMAAAGLGFALWKDQHTVEVRAAGLTGGDPHAGRDALVRYGCGACHTIPGVRGAQGLVGPPLTAFGKRILVAGRLHNSPENVIHWIVDPQDVSPETAMPNTGVTENDARNITAYLYTLR